MIFKNLDTLKEDVKTLYIRFPRKIKNVHEVRALHPHITVVRMPRQTRARYCFAEFDDDQTASDVLHALKKVNLNGKKLFVTYSVNRQSVVKTVQSVEDREENSYRLFVGGITQDTSLEDLQKLFPNSKYVKFPIIHGEQRKGYAFVGFDNEEQTKKALASSKTLQLNGKMLVVNRAKSKSDRSGRQLSSPKTAKKLDQTERSNSKEETTSHKRKKNHVESSVAKKQKIQGVETDTKSIGNNEVLMSENLAMKQGLKCQKEQHKRKVVVEIKTEGESAEQEVDTNESSEEEMTDVEEIGESDNISEGEEVIDVKKLLSPSKQKNDPALVDIEDDDDDTVEIRKLLTPSKSKSYQEDDSDAESDDENETLSSTNAYKHNRSVFQNVIGCNAKRTLMKPLAKTLKSEHKKGRSAEANRKNFKKKKLGR